MLDDVFRPGELCGTYRIIKLLGRGGFADVYQAIDVETQQKVALKCLQLRHLTNAQLTQRMVAETELLAGLDHPNVVQVEDAGINGGVLWLAMEYISGGTLRERLRKERGPLPAATALSYARQIAEGVGAAHSMKVVHRDLKPENIMITDKNEVKVLDLGAAKFFGKEFTDTGSKGAIGTPLYMAPEQIKGEVVDVRTDVYALGVILYEMLAGRHPFAQPTGDMPPAFEIGTLHLHAQPKPLTNFVTNLSADVCRVVERAIEKDPAKRFASMGEFAAAIRGASKRSVLSVEGGAGKVTGAPSPSPSPWRGLRLVDPEGAGSASDHQSGVRDVMPVLKGTPNVDTLLDVEPPRMESGDEAEASALAGAGASLHVLAGAGAGAGALMDADEFAGAGAEVFEDAIARAADAREVPWAVNSSEVPVAAPAVDPTEAAPATPSATSLSAVSDPSPMALPPEALRTALSADFSRPAPTPSRALAGAESALQQDQEPQLPPAAPPPDPAPLAPALDLLTGAPERPLLIDAPSAPLSPALLSALPLPAPLSSPPPASSGRGSPTSDGARRSPPSSSLANTRWKRLALLQAAAVTVLIALFMRPQGAAVVARSSLPDAPALELPASAPEAEPPIAALDPSAAEAQVAAAAAVADPPLVSPPPASKVARSPHHRGVPSRRAGAARSPSASSAGVAPGAGASPSRELTDTVQISASSNPCASKLLFVTGDHDGCKPAVTGR